MSTGGFRTAGFPRSSSGNLNAAEANFVVRHAMRLETCFGRVAAMSFSAFDLIAMLLVLTATFGWVNHRFIKLPNTIGMLVMGLAASLLLIAVEVSVPEVSLYDDLTRLVGEIDFQSTVLNWMLAFLLFAGALHVDLGLLRMRASVVGTMATFGVVISTAVVGLGFWAISNFLGVGISLPWAMVFGALISPTDPVAVLSTLKAVRVPKSLEIDMIGESLFNDGVGVVIFTVILAVAIGFEGGNVDILHVAELFVVEALGGAVLGLLAGYIAYRAMLAIDDYPIEVLISLALVTGVYSLAAKLHLSGPIAVVVGGLLIGNRGAALAMSDETQRYLFGFLDPDRRDSQLGAVFADRFGSSGPEVRSILDLARRRQHSACSFCAPAGGRCPGSGSGLPSGFHSGNHSRPRVGRAARRHLGCFGAVDSRHCGKINPADGDLYSGCLHDCGPGA